MFYVTRNQSLLFHLWLGEPWVLDGGADPEEVTVREGRGRGSTGNHILPIEAVP